MDWTKTAAGMITDNAKILYGIMPLSANIGDVWYGPERWMRGWMGHGWSACLRPWSRYESGITPRTYEPMTYVLFKKHIYMSIQRVSGDNPEEDRSSWLRLMKIPSDDATWESYEVYGDDHLINRYTYRTDVLEEKIPLADDTPMPRFTFRTGGVDIAHGLSLEEAFHFGETYVPDTQGVEWTVNDVPATGEMPIDPCFDGESLYESPQVQPQDASVCGGWHKLFRKRR